ncbi:MAG TPA: Hsp20/alpha crystallin family protein [bacterium]|mgnify:CR=1 FL=1|nr:Hsp20/alpha crystallin family protein [bacterium]HPT29859.1 Hsp20/alpha crystallin family protein [bacterium]
MSLIKWTPFWADNSFEDMEKMFSENLPAVRGNQMGFTPAIDMYEDKDQVIVETQLAGIDPEKVDLTVDNDVLTIKGESEKKSEVEDKNYYRQEIRRGSFFRSIPLPAKVLGDKASAITANGILKVSIPKAPTAEPKAIKIQTQKK